MYKQNLILFLALSIKCFSSEPNFDAIFGGDSSKSGTIKKEIINDQEAKNKMDSTNTPGTILGGWTASALTEKGSSSNNYSSDLKYGCKFCCEGKWGNCRSDTFQVNTPYSNSADAQNYVRKQYKSTCEGYSFSDGSGYSASVGFPNCETYYYEK